MTYGSGLSISTDMVSIHFRKKHTKEAAVDFGWPADFRLLPATLMLSYASSKMEGNGSPSPLPLPPVTTASQHVWVILTMAGLAASQPRHHDSGSKAS